MVKSVKFNNNITVKYISINKISSIKPGLKDKNRKLRNIERYMKKIDLLLNNEFLDFTDIKAKHIRLPYITYIAKNKKMIKNNENLIIIS